VSRKGRLAPRLGALLAGLWIGAAPAVAEPERQADPAAARPGRAWFQDRLEIRAAAIFGFIDSDLEIPPDIDLEGDLDLDEFAVEPSFDLLWRFSENRRHRLRVDYFSLLRSATETLEFTLDLPDLPPIPVGVRTRTDLDLHVISLTYGYAILQSERRELGLFGGLDFILADAQVKAQVPGLGEVEGDLFEDEFKVPFPTVGAFWSWAFMEELAFRTQFQAFGVKVGDVSGALFKGNLGLQHDTFRHVNLFLRYEFLGGTASVDGSLDDFSLFSHGPAVGIGLRF
jgi:hypothetical protein